MVDEWRVSAYGPFSIDYYEDRLEDLCVAKDGIQTGPFGSQLHQRDYVERGTPIITVKHLGDNRIIHQDLPLVSDADKTRLAKYTLNAGDIVFSRVGSVDRRAYVTDSENGWLFSGRCLRVRVDPDKMDSRFLSYFFGLPSFQEHIRSIAVGATMPSLNTQILSNIKIHYPPLPEQRAIAQILGALDDKIELNRRMNGTLEAMARAFFKSWFVDFDPVRAKMEGRDTGLPPHIAALFPDRLVPSELGEIPEGWEMGAVGDYFHLTMGQSPPGSTYNDIGNGLPFFQGRTDFGFRYPKNRKFCTEPKRLAQAEDTLVSVRAPVGDINRAWETSCIGRGVAALRHRSLSSSYTYYSAMELQKVIEQFEHTGTVFGSINKSQFANLQVIEPSTELVNAWNDYISPQDERIRTNSAEATILADLRDTLLPRLVSGEVKV